MLRQVRNNFSFPALVGPVGQSPLELDMGLPVLQENPNFLWKALCDRLPTKTFLAFGWPYVDLRCPRCQYLETTIHILRECAWAKEVWHQSPGLLPLPFFQLPLQEWL